MHRLSRIIYFLPLFLILISTRSIVAAPVSNWQEKVESRVLEDASSDMAEQLESKQEKGEFVVKCLKAAAEKTQKPILDFLTAEGVEHRSFWIANLIWVQSDYNVLETIARRNDKSKIYSDQK